MEIITTSKNNKYLYEEETGFLSLLCGDLCDNLKENKVSLIDEKKQNIWRNMDLLTESQYLQINFAI